MPGCSRIASTATRSPWTTLNTPSGRPASASSSARRMLGEGSCSDGLRMKALPHASATGAIHSGTMTGKLNGVMPATTPSGIRIECESTPPDTCGVMLALEQLAEAAGELDHLEPARDLAARVVEHLAVLARDQGGELVLVGGDQLAEGEHHLRPARERRRAPAARRLGGRRDRAVDVVGGGERDARDHLAGGRVGHLAVTLGGALVAPAADPVVQQGLARGGAHGSASWHARVGALQKLRSVAFP